MLGRMSGTTCAIHCLSLPPQVDSPLTRQCTLLSSSSSAVCLVPGRGSSAPPPWLSDKEVG